jgi:hypothetical protein
MHGRTWTCRHHAILATDQSARVRSRIAERRRPSGPTSEGIVPTTTENLDLPPRAGRQPHGDYRETPREHVRTIATYPATRVSVHGMRTVATCPATRVSASGLFRPASQVPPSGAQPMVGGHTKRRTGAAIRQLIDRFILFPRNMRLSMGKSCDRRSDFRGQKRPNGRGQWRHASARLWCAVARPACSWATKEPLGPSLAHPTPPAR